MSVLSIAHLRYYGGMGGGMYYGGAADGSDAGGDAGMYYGKRSRS